MELEIINNETESRFETSIDNHLAEVVYTKTDKNQLMITGTHVPKELEGKGIAGAITKFALEYARENNLKVVPICSYTVAYFKKHPEFNDLLESHENK